MTKKIPDVKLKVIGKKKRMIFYFHGLGSNSSVFSIMEHNLKSEYSIVLFDYPYDILSSDTKKTVAYFNKILQKVKYVIGKFKPKEITFFGTSLGGFISIYIAGKIEIDKLILSVSGLHLSDVYWTGTTLSYIKEELVNKGYDLARLKKEFKAIEPKKIKVKNNVLAFTSQNDRAVLYQYQKDLSDSLNAFEVKETILGHKLTAAKNLLDLKRVKNFLKND